MPSVATAIDVARLYDELRDCVRANDQEGVKRVFNELVRARRPVTEILDEVRSISKERERSEPERDVTPLREWPPRSPSPEAEPSTPGLTFRNFGPAVDPRPVPEPPDTAGSATNPVPERVPRSMNGRTRIQRPSCRRGRLSRHLAAPSGSPMPATARRRC